MNSLVALFRPLVRGVFAVVPLLVGVPAFSQSPGTGTIEGRVVNPATGEYTERARVWVEGTAIETFSDVDGRFRLVRVPAGSVRVQAFYTGASFVAQSVNVSPGGVAQVNFEWAGARAGEAVVKMQALEVAASKEMSGSAIAINTQRFAPNTMTVITADEFGPVAGNNIAEVLRSVPGVVVEYGSLGDAASFTLNGSPGSYVPVTVNNLPIANSAAGAGGRQVAIHQLSVNNMSRFEVVFTPTAETPGAALAGTINLVPRSAFERARPSYEFTGSLNLRSHERSFRRTAVPGVIRRSKITPDLNFAAVVPVNERFGFTFSANRTMNYIPLDRSRNNWRGLFSATNGTTFPDTTPDRPYLSETQVNDGHVHQKKTGAAMTMDYRLTGRDVISVSSQYGESQYPWDTDVLSFNVGGVAPGNFDSSFTRGSTGAGIVEQQYNSGHQVYRFWTHGATWRHNGPVWRAETGLGYSTSKLHTKAHSGYEFSNVVARLTGVTVGFADNTAQRPGTITVTRGPAATPVDPYSLANYSIISVNRFFNDWLSEEHKVYANAGRDLDLAVPVRLKTGIDVNRSIRDTRNDPYPMTFVGADGIANNADNAATPFVDPNRSGRDLPIGYARLQRVDPGQMSALYRSNPGYFVLDQTGQLNQRQNQSKHSEEVISAAFLRADASLLRGRLKMTGGLRAEQTNVKGEGRLTDPTLNFRRDAAGNVVRAPNGQPVLIHAANSFDALQITNVDRGLRAKKEYLRWFPSLNATYGLTDNFLIRGGYFHSVGRPPISQYAGTLTLPNLESPPGPANVIAVNNAGIKAWDARTFKLSLEYYFKDVGLFSVAGFSRTVENFFGAREFAPTDDFLSLYGLDADVYGQFSVRSQVNLPGAVRLTGWDFNYKQALTFLPTWASGVQVFVNGAAQRVTGENADEFAGYVPRTANWGASLTRPRFTLRARWNYTSRNRAALIAPGRSIPESTYNWRAARTLLNLSGDFHVSRHFTLFANWVNVTEDPMDLEIAGPQTPAVARLRSHETLGGSLLSVGLKTRF